jgi:hypothetical protein
MGASNVLFKIMLIVVIDASIKISVDSIIVLDVMLNIIDLLN